MLLATGTALAGDQEALGGQASIQRLYEEAQAARAQGNFVAAEEKYLEVIRRSPQFARAYHNLGIVYFVQQKFTLALARFEKATSLDPRLAEAYAMKGLSHYQLYQSEQAARAFERALRLNPRDDRSLLFLARSLIRLRDYRAAALKLEKLAELKPDDPDVLYSLSLCRMKLLQEAVEKLGKAAPRSYQYWLLLAQDAEARGADDLAIRNYKEALQANRQAQGVHYALGNALVRMGKFKEATEEFRKELELNPHDPLALWKLGDLVLRTDPQEARGYLEQAVRQNPELPQVLLAYGRALARLGETQKAIEQFRRVVRLAPEEQTVHYHLATAYRRLGRDEEAKTEFARFRDLARKRSERKQAVARELMEMDLPPADSSAEPEPDFSAEP